MKNGFQKSRARVAIVGGGVSGLSAAHYLTRSGQVDVTVFEATNRPGGLIHTEKHGNFLVESGPDALVRMKPAGIDLCRELGLEGEFLSQPDEGVGTRLVHNEQLLPLPAGLMLGVPRDPWPTLGSSLLTWKGKLRLLLEPLIPRGNPAAGDDESVSDFVTRRLGKEAAEKLVGPLLEGIFAGRADELSIRSCFPQLVGLETRHGSLVVGANLLNPKTKGAKAAPRLVGMTKAFGIALAAAFKPSGAPAASPFLTLRSGLQTLINALAAPLGERIRLNTEIIRMEPWGSGWELHLKDPSTSTLKERFDAVILALPAHKAKSLVPEGLSAPLSQVRYSRVGIVFLGYNKADIPELPKGSGIVVPRGEGDILSMTLMHQKWTGRSADGEALFRVFVGGERGLDITQMPPSALSAVARRELARLLGIQAEPTLTKVFKLAQGTPLPTMGFTELLSQIEDGFSELPNLYWAAAGFGGIGIADCVQRAKSVADQLLNSLKSSP